MKIKELVDGIPGQYHIIGDAAYVLSDKLIIPYTAGDRNIESNDIFNFFLSQLRIRIEMAFGLLTAKWRVLRKPLEVSLENGNCSKVILSCGILHNFILTEQSEDFKNHNQVRKMAEPFSEEEDPDGLGYWEPTPHKNDLDMDLDHLRQYLQSGTSLLRDRLRDTIRDEGYERPTSNIQRRNRIDG